MTEWLHPALLMLLGALVLPLLAGVWQKLLSVLVPVLALISVAQITPGSAGQVHFAGVDLVLFQADQLSLVFAWVFAIMAVIGNIYAWHINDTGQRVSALLYIGSAFGVVFAGDWFTLLVAWEVMAFASAYLIFASANRAAVAAGFRYLMVHVAGGVLLFGGIILHGLQTGSYLIGPLDHGQGGLAYNLILISFMLNAAVPPLSAWLTDAYPEATVTGAVFLSAFTTKTAVYVLIRNYPGAEVLVGFGVAMALYGVVFAVLENDCRRLLGYHIISQVGYMVAAVGMGTEMALNGATSHAFAHILYKGLLFMGAGAVILMTGRRKLTELGGLYRTMPITVFLYMIGALAISAFPLFSGFVSKSMIISAAAGDHRAVVVLLLTVASSGTFLHTGLKLPYYMFFGKDCGLRPSEPPLNMLLAMGLAALFCIGIGLFPQLLYAQLPYPVDYHPYSGAHVTESLALLMFTLLAFVLFLKYLDPEKTISLDTDWFYRRGASLFMWIARRPVLIWEQWLITLGDGAGLRLLHHLSRLSLRIDTRVVDAAVNGVAATALRLGNLLRHLQTGIVSHYAWAMIAGVTLLLGWPIYVAMGTP
ncbi:Na(+)/H(+) antiporter subunit D [Parasedimentitalea psychrophila]|uniref:Na(+)/H(+) antiporter subunit D n=1 Tax=Parasedimentitalea psychrophila TaxID=2997337 RepID=A0A9Y2L2H6_9RHOB|nr:Na(+)/H(+) antiporter subunit D [Parasedimentitalea psychrophila]WIY25669.1 Na(+)/H(+) antiporter subunit D [Parasedimentitalea psychrophila]